jgi:hypothetical protein
VQQCIIGKYVPVSPHDILEKENSKHIIEIDGKKDLEKKWP